MELPKLVSTFWKSHREIRRNISRSPFWFDGFVNPISLVENSPSEWSIYPANGIGNPIHIQLTRVFKLIASCYYSVFFATVHWKGYYNPDLGPTGTSTMVSRRSLNFYLTTNDSARSTKIYRSARVLCRLLYIKPLHYMYINWSVFIYNCSDVFV